MTRFFTKLGDILKKFDHKKIRKGLKEFIGLSQLPIYSVLSPVHFEINSNKEVIIEGCKCILKYDEYEVRISVKGMIVTFIGRNLSIKCLSQDSLIVEGFVTSIEFLT